jgi:hypothetical protein
MIRSRDPATPVELLGDDADAWPADATKKTKATAEMAKRFMCNLSRVSGRAIVLQDGTRVQAIGGRSPTSRKVPSSRQG